MASKAPPPDKLKAQQHIARFTQRVWLFAAAIILLGWSALAWNLMRAMDERETAVRAQISRLSNALQMQVGQVLESIDIAMISMAGRIAEENHTPAEIEHILLAEGKRLPAFFSLLFIDANGRGTASSVPEYKPGGNFADRDYFKAHLGPDRPTTFIGGPLIGRTLGKQFFAVSRRVETEEGKFLGVLMGSVEPKYFADIFEEFPLGPHGAISLLHTASQKIVARSPAHNEHFAQDVSKGQLFTQGLLSNPRGVYEATTATDGATRVIAYQKIKNAPLVMLVGFARKDLHAEFVTMRNTYLIAGGLLALLIGTLAWQLGRAHRHTLSLIEIEAELNRSRQRESETLRESQALLNRAQAVAKLGSWHLDLKKNQLFWSDETCRIFGTPSGCPLAYEDFIARVHPDDRAAVNAAWQAALEGAPYDITHRIMVENETKWVREMAEFMFEASGEFYAATGTVQDVSKLKEVEDALIEAKRAAEAANRAKSEFLANMSHEIRTPMNAILGLTQLVLDTPLEARQRDFLGKALNSGRALLGILNDILDYSKIEAGRLDIDHTPYSVEEVLHEIGDLFSAHIAEKGIELFFDLAPDLPAEVLGDPLRLHQVLANLIGNAIKFTERGEIHVLAEVITPVAERETATTLTLRFAVRDTGIGIRREIAHQLFEPFTQADGSITRKYGGTGLGLAICYRLVTLMGGQIAASGDAGQGATFTFTLMVGRSHSHPASEPLQTITGMKVLVVDDQSSARDILSRLLTAWEVDNDTAPDGYSALEQLRLARAEGHPFDTVLIDWQMPGMDGIEIARQIAADPASYGETTKVMMVTAHDREKLIQAANELRLDGILTKPVTPSLLFDALMGKHSEPPASPASRVRQKSALTGRHFGGARILVAEDNRYNQQVAAGFLEKLGIVVTLADNGSEAVAMAAHARFDAIIMDLHMPVLDGLEATRQIRALPHGGDVPIIAMTAAVMEEDRMHCRDAGMNDFIPKPIDPDELIRVLGCYLSAIPIEAASSTQASAPLPDLPGFDLPAALQRTGGDRALLERLLSDFSRTHEDFPDRLAALLAEGNLHQAARELHTLKGVTSNLGMTDLAEAVRQVEAEVRAGKVPAIAALTLKLVAARQAIAALATTDNGSAAAPDNAAVAALLEQLRPYLEERELVPDAVLQTLTAFARAGLPGAPFARLLRQIDDFDHDGALASLAQIAAQFGLPLHSSP